MNDAISRKAVLWITAETGALETQRRVRELPSLDVAPVVWCNMCKYYEQDTGFCQYWGCGNHMDGFCNKGARMDGEAHA